MDGENIKYAGFWARALAQILDGLIIGIPSTFIVYALLADETGRNILYFILTTVITVSFWVGWGGRTPGKKLLGIRIVTYPDFGEINLAKSLIRYLLGYTLSAVILFLGFIMVAFREDKRGLHDLLAGTCVIHERQ